ncbi:hypothetical protein [Poseidonocella sp. HB161398]|uniref:hypothetical protein n=1 Tax=Poseidonocella sp. HB161398 TaxID=2320855 RepID=UPI001486C040|nr:hypothetical protein [Poseidonocella sp. HB161398]
MIHRAQRRRDHGALVISGRYEIVAGVDETAADLDPFAFAGEGRQRYVEPEVRLAVAGPGIVVGLEMGTVVEDRIRFGFADGGVLPDADVERCGLARLDHSGKPRQCRGDQSLLGASRL